MDKQLDFYQVDAQYIAYLLKHDSRVPKVDYSAEQEQNEVGKSPFRKRHQ